MDRARQRVGLILTGGGARAAYQVGVLKAISEILPRHAHSPFQVVCGTSAGALNAVTLAVNAMHFRRGVKYLLNIWQQSRVNDIYRADVAGVLANTVRVLAGLVLSALGSNRLDRISLLDNRPLATFLEQTLPCDKIQEAIDAGVLHALSVTASGYSSGHSVTFYQGAADIQPWKRTRRMGVPTQIGVEHLMASSAIPFMFPAVHIHREYFGDGSMRQIAPISSALHLGAERVLVVGMVHQGDGEAQQRTQSHAYPSLAQIAGHALDSIFLDGLEVDIERLNRINQTLRYIPEAMHGKIDLRPVEVLVVSPSQPLEAIAERFVANLPWPIRFLLRVAGVLRGSGVGLVSYLLFEKHHCRALIDLGYQDAMKRKEEIVQFLAGGNAAVRDASPQ